jgi:1,4-alpha-glucan branching enzyme
MIIRKQYLKSKPVCKVTFGLSPAEAGEADSVHLVGEFNGWNKTATPMKKKKDGSFSVTVDLEAGKEYAFRYLINGTRWINAENADKSTPTPFADAENSVIVL